MATVTEPDNGSNDSRLIIALILICTCIELVLQFADWNFLNAPRLRQTAYEFGGFWPGLLGNWRPNYQGQPVAMFVTYGFLHGGLSHLIVNMITLWSLGMAVMSRVGAWRTSGLYCASLLGGAVGYTLLSPGLSPMVGASGALFGLAGGLLAWSYVDRFTYGQGLWPIAQAMVALIVLNLVLWWAMNGNLAWETHLGGFIAGWIAAIIIDPRPQQTEPDKATSPHKK